MATPQSPNNAYKLTDIGAQVGAYGGAYASFTADTLAHAQTLAQSYATLFGVSVKLVALETDPSLNISTYSPGSQGSTVSSPSGVSWSPR